MEEEVGGGSNRVSTAIPLQSAEMELFKPDTGYKQVNVYCNINHPVKKKAGV